MMLIQRPRRRKVLVVLLNCLLAWLCLPPGTARAAGPYVRIEQDWEIHLGSLDAAQYAPQFSIMLEPYRQSPRGGILLINYADLPTLALGGVQLQLWDGDVAMALQSHASSRVLDINNSHRKLNFTLFMEVRDGRLYFGVKEGDFLASWVGSVPDDGWVISMPYSELTTFTGHYDTADSAAGSGVLVGTTENVSAITIKAVRKYDAAGNLDSESVVNVFP